MDDLFEKWPHLGRPRRIPLRSLRGATEESTAAATDAAYLHELGRQATIFNKSLTEAMDAALEHDDVEGTWRHLQGAMFAAIIVARLIHPRMVFGWPGVSRAQAKKTANTRAERLRDLLCLPDPSADERLETYRVSEVRDAMEHIDERIDRACRDGDYLVDWYLSDGSIVVTDDAKDGQFAPGLRYFVPHLGVLGFGATRLHLFRLDVEMLQLRRNTKEALAELKGAMRGRMIFGGQGRLEVIDVPAGGAAPLQQWLTERRRLQSELGDPADAG